MGQGAAKISRRRHGIIVKEVNPITARGFHGDVALDGRMFASGDEDVEAVGGVIEMSRGLGGLDLGLIGPRSDDDRNAREKLAHKEKAKGRRRKFKVESASAHREPGFVPR